jgi:putative transposase
VSLEQRQETISMIDHARVQGARLKQACECVDIDAATYRRWQCDGEVLTDQRATAIRPVPLNKLSVEERKLILLTCHLPTFQSLPPSQIVPTLADLGQYIGSESSFYRILVYFGPP